MLAFDPSVKHHAPAFPAGQADRFCFTLISADAGPNAGAYANTLAGHQSELRRMIRPAAPPQIDSIGTVSEGQPHHRVAIINHAPPVLVWQPLPIGSEVVRHPLPAVVVEAVMQSTC